jgi:hypothetical protein
MDLKSFIEEVKKDDKKIKELLEIVIFDDKIRKVLYKRITGKYFFDIYKICKCCKSLIQFDGGESYVDYLECEYCQDFTCVEENCSHLFSIELDPDYGLLRVCKNCLLNEKYEKYETRRGISEGFFLPNRDDLSKNEIEMFIDEFERTRFLFSFTSDECTKEKEKEFKNVIL